MAYSILVVGTSWGGLNALRELVGALPEDFRLPAVLVQHRHRQSDHLLIDRGFFTLSTDPPVRYSRPSIDVTFYSAADAYGAATVGVVLTGANSDGSRGLRRIFDRGGLALVQDPVTAESPAMPSAAVRCVPGARVETIAQIAATVAGLAVASPDDRPPRTTRSERRSDEPHHLSPPGSA